MPSVSVITPPVSSRTASMASANFFSDQERSSKYAVRFGYHAARVVKNGEQGGGKFLFGSGAILKTCRNALKQSSCHGRGKRSIGQQRVVFFVAQKSHLDRNDRTRTPVASRPVLFGEAPLLIRLPNAGTFAIVPKDRLCRLTVFLKMLRTALGRHKHKCTVLFWDWRNCRNAGGYKTGARGTRSCCILWIFLDHFF